LCFIMPRTNKSKSSSKRQPKPNPGGVSPPQLAGEMVYVMVPKGKVPQVMSFVNNLWQYPKTNRAEQRSHAAKSTPSTSVTTTPPPVLEDKKVVSLQPVKATAAAKQLVTPKTRKTDKIPPSVSGPTSCGSTARETIAKERAESRTMRNTANRLDMARKFCEGAKAVSDSALATKLLARGHAEYHRCARSLDSLSAYELAEVQRTASTYSYARTTRHNHQLGAMLSSTTSLAAKGLREGSSHIAQNTYARVARGESLSTFRVTAEQITTEPDHYLPVLIG